jgi:hypothetical protein
MATRKCGAGKFYRKSYTRKRTRIAGRCIRSQTRYTSRPVVNRRSLRGVRLSRRVLRNCPTGYIKRASYARKTRGGRKSVVREQCIRDVGAPGKGLIRGPGIGPLRSGELAKFGYTHVVSLPVAKRHAALTRAVKAYGSLGVWRKLNAVQVYTRRLSPASSKVFKADMDWVRGKYGIKAF